MRIDSARESYARQTQNSRWDGFGAHAPLVNSEYRGSREGKKLSAKQIISLLREQERLSEQLRQTGQEENIVALEFGTQEETSV